MNAQFEKRTVRKYYVALVDGNIPNPSGSLKDYLHKDIFQKSDYNQPKKPGKPGGKVEFQENRLSWTSNFVKNRVIDGQIPSNQSSISLYRLSNSRRYALRGTAWDKEGIGLHASALQFDHPETKERITIKSDWDIDFIPI